MSYPKTTLCIIHWVGSAIVFNITCKMFHVIFLCLALSASPVLSSNDDKAFQEVVPSSDVGDYRRHCLPQLNSGVYVFDVLPIYGFDNLRNEDMEMVISPSYSKCKLTDDGKFLLPDDVYLLPLKQIELQTFAELITHWHNYSSATSKSINVDAGLSIRGFGISGKYADDFIKTKSKQVLDRSFSTRVQLRSIPYKVKLQPTAAFHPNFKSALIKIANLLQIKDHSNARYESEMLIRVYGTHVVTSMDAGAAIVQEDFISKNLILQDEATKHDVLATASVNLFRLVNIADGTYETSNSQEISDFYEKSKISSDIKTYGGFPSMFTDFIGAELVQKLDKYLVAMDRSGDPLYNYINKENLPEMSASMVRQVSDYVKNAIEDYYEHNTYRGCTNVDSPNFLFIANVDDGNCKPPLTNLTFGGVYQTCKMEPGSTAGDLCGTSSEPNPKTGTYSCPSGYKTIELHTNVFTKSYSSRSCHFCWKKFKRCCQNHDYFSTANVTTYWCAAERPILQDSGYLFGGIYSNETDNPLTKDRSCPETFYPRKFGSELYICISDDFQKGFKLSLPFAGFYSCTMGNPLAKYNQDVTNTRANSQKAYYSNKGTVGWPKKCPDGFMAKLAIIEQGCAIHYCTDIGALSAEDIPPIRRPPFSVKVSFTQLTTRKYEHIIQNETPNTILLRNGTRSTHLVATSDASATQKYSDNPSTMSMFDNLVCLVVIIIIIALVLLGKHTRQSSQIHYSKLENISTDCNDDDGLTYQMPTEKD